MRSIVEAVQRPARMQPERPAILFEGQTTTYGALYASVERMARALRASGLAPGDRVALFLENCPEFVVAYLGVHLAGGVVVLVNSQYRQVELSHILADSGARLCVTSAAGAGELIGLPLPALETLVIVGESQTVSAGAHVVGFEEFLVRGDEQTGAATALPDADAPAVIAYTSGTTGRAKGALLLHRNLTANVAAVSAAWDWTDADRLLLALPLFHTHGLMVGMHGTLYTGASARLLRRFDAAEVLAILKDDADVTMFFGVPTMYRRLVAEAERVGAPARQLRLYVSGSAPLDAQLFAEFARVFGQTILERYGMTETIMNLTNPYQGERRPGTVGGPFPGQEARVVDVATRQPLPDGETGEIEVRGPHIFAGYWNRPDATAEAFAADGWFKTGDLGWRSPDGYYTIAARARELIISGGFNVYPREVEDVLATHPAIAEVAVIGLPDEDLGEQVVAVIVPVDGFTVNLDELADFCRARLASYKKPRRVVVVESLPRNALGKVQKHLLAAQIPPA
jgi:malonyl-CoA/methylmalonyl-CoA synthetase